MKFNSYLKNLLAPGAYYGHIVSPVYRNLSANPAAIEDSFNAGQYEFEPRMTHPLPIMQKSVFQMLIR